MEIALNNGGGRAPERHLFPVTFATYLHLRKEGNCEVVVHPKLREPLVKCICSKWRNERHMPSASEETDAEQAVEHEVPVGKIILEGSTCLECAKEICEKTQYLQDLSPMGSGRDKPLHHCVITENLTMFCHLIMLVGEKGDLQAVVHALRETNERAETVLHVAIIAGIRDAVEVILWMDPQLVRIACHDVSPIYLAVSLGRKEIAEILHDSLDPDAGQSCYSGPNGKNALHAAILVGDDMIQTVLAWNKGKVLTQGKDENGNSPLHFAVSVQKPRHPWKLLQKQRHPWKLLLKADPSMAHEPNSGGLVPLHIAAMTNKKDAVKILCENCIGCIYLRDKQGRTFLHIAAQNNGLDVVKYVSDKRLEFGPLCNIQDKNGDTALHLAVDDGNLKMLCALLKNPCVSLNIWNDKGQTALDIAKSRIRPGFFYALNPDIMIYKILLYVDAEYGSYQLDHLQGKNADKEEAENKVKEKQEKEESKNLTSATQTLSIGAVLIATVSFGVTFGIPGGYKADDHVNGGTPTLAGRWYFDAFMIANTLAFLCSSSATLCLMYSGMPLVSLPLRRKCFNASSTFAMWSITSLIAAFALGVYMVLAPVARSTAIAICAMCPLAFLFASIQITPGLFIFEAIAARKDIQHGMFVPGVFI